MNFFLSSHSCAVSAIVDPSSTGGILNDFGRLNGVHKRLHEEYVETKGDVEHHFQVSRF